MPGASGARGLVRAAKGTLDVVHSTRDSESLSAVVDAAETLGGFDFVDRLVCKRMNTVYATLADRGQHDPENKFMWISTVSDGLSCDRERRVKDVQEQGFQFSGHWGGLMHFRKLRTECDMGTAGTR